MYIQQTINIEANDVAGLSAVAKSGNYSDLKNRPTKLSEFENDLGMGRGSTGSGGNTYVHPDTHPASMITGLAAVATSGKYSDLSGKPSAYTLPKASSSTLGGIKVGSNLTIDSNGVLSAVIPNSSGGGSSSGSTVIIPNIQGTVTTLSPGSQVTINRTGTNENPIFNFGIPQGLKGDKGDTGATGPQGPQGPKGDPGQSTASNMYIDVTSFGAVGNGSTYCDQAIMNAYNEAFSTNKTLFIPQGIYRTKTTMTFNKKVNILMEGIIEQDTEICRPIIVIGGDIGTTLKSVKATLKARRSTKNNYVTYAWKTSDDIAVKIQNLESSNIVVDEASYCYVGVAFCSYDSPLMNSTITLGNLYTNKIGIEFEMRNTTGNGSKIKHLTLYGGIINKDPSILTTNSHYNYGIFAVGLTTSMVEDVVSYDLYVNLQNAYSNSCFVFSNCNGFKMINFAAENIREDHLYEKSSSSNNIELIRRNEVRDNVVKTPVQNGVLQLTTDKYQTTQIASKTTIQLPTVKTFTEIHLIFSPAQTMTIVLPKIKWQQNNNEIEANKTYEFIFTYIDNSWMGGCIVYE